ENHISACLDSLVLQSYPPEMRQFIVVNDHSSDNTAAIIKGFSQSGVQLIDLADHVSGKHNSYKKKAIEVAISYAAGELIVTSDADCIFPPRWLETLGAFYVSRNAAFIAAPVRIKPERSLLSI